MFSRLLILFTIVLALGCTRKAEDTGNTISFAMKMNLSSLDPAQASNEATNEVLPNIYETLLEYHYLKRPLVIQPLLAAKMPEVSKDGLTHTFKIKPGVKFQDSDAFAEGKGRVLKSQDFVYAWKRLADPSTKSDGFWIFDGKIKGLNEWRDKLTKGEGQFDDPVEGLQAPDDETLIIKLNQPYFQLHYVLTMAYSAPVAREVVEKFGAEFLNNPVGTGPFKFESWTRGNKVTLVRNPSYHGGSYPAEGAPGDQEKGLLADAGKPLPFVDKLIFYEMPEDQPRWLNLMKGAVDYVGIPKDNFDAAVIDGKLKPELAEKGFWLESVERPDVVYISFNMEDPLLGKNANLRKALAHAYDTETAMKKFFNNQAVIAHSPIAPGMEGYDPSFKNPYKEFNLAKAKEFLKKAGFPDGKGLPSLEYSTSGSSTTRQMAEYLAQQFGAIGVKVNIVSNSWPQFQDRIRQKKSQIFGIAWNADYPDAENMLQLLYGKNVSPGPNNANFQNKAFDELYEKALRLPPGPERTKLYQKMRDIFAQEMPWIPTVHRLGHYVVHGWVKNFKKHETIPATFKYIKVDTAKKAELKAKL